MIMNESAENYLEVILKLSRQLPVVRSIDIATELGYSKSSVSTAMKHLKKENCISVSEAGFIFLTDAGKKIADMIYERHEVITKLLENLGVPTSIASKDACKIEHYLSEESFEAIKNIL